MGHASRGGYHVDIAGRSEVNKWNIVSIGKGTVVAAVDGYEEGTGSDYGNYVRVNYGDGLNAIYGHMHKGLLVKVGDTVDYGQVLGKLGHTGNSSGAHLHFEVRINGDPGDATLYIDPDNPRPTTSGSGGSAGGTIENPAYTFSGKSQSYYGLSDEQLKIFEAVIIAEGGTDPESVFWTASAMFNRIDYGFYGDHDAWKILSRGWSGAYNDNLHQQYLNQTDTVDSIVKEVMNGKRAHKYIDFGCDVPGNTVASNWIASHPGEKYQWFKGNMYCDWKDSLS